jgi:hypothetical protein
MRLCFCLLLSSALGGCSTDCGDVWDPLDRDWCWSDEAASAAQAGDLSRATKLLGNVSSDRVRAATTERIVTIAPPGIDRPSALQLCDALATTNALRCRASWDREEMWGSW